MMSSMNVALPTLQRVFDANAVLLGMVETIYMATTSVAMMPSGKLGDTYGRRLMFEIGTIIFALASFGCAFSPVMGIFLAMRAAQGIGAAFIMVSSIAIVVSVFPPHQRGAAIGFNSAAVYIGASAGPFISGFILQYATWREIFWVPAAIALTAWAAIRVALKKAEWKVSVSGRFDVEGCLYYGAGIVALVFGLAGIGGTRGTLLTLVGFFFAGVFIRQELRTDNPILDLLLFTSNRTFTFSAISAYLSYMSVTGVSFLLSLYLQYTRGLSPLEAGLILLTQPVVQAFAAPLTGKLSDRIQPRYLSTAGMVLTVTGLLLLTRLGPGTDLTAVRGILVLLGTGYGLFVAPNTNAIMSSVESRRYGQASGITSVMRILGQLSSMTAVTVIIALLLGRVHLGPENADDLLLTIRTCLIFFACCCSTGIWFSFSRGNIKK